MDRIEEGTGVEMTQQAGMHRIVADFRGTDLDVREIVRKIPGPTSTVSNALLLLHEFIHGQASANGSFLAARNVEIAGMDAGLCILFLVSWAHAAFLQSSIVPEKHTEAWTLLHRARTLIDEKTPRELVSYLELIEARLVGRDGDRLGEEEGVRKAFSKLPSTSPRSRFMLLELADTLARSGRLPEIDKDLARTSTQPGSPSDRSQLNVLRFTNSVEAGQREQAIQLLNQIEGSAYDKPVALRISRYRMLLELMHDESIGGLAGSALEPTEADMPDWALVIKCLLTKREHQALRWARVSARKDTSFTVDNDFMSFNMIRAELAEGNALAARRLIDMRREKGNAHYMDSFFLSRIELLSDAMDPAVEHFARVISDAKRYDAIGRINLELRLASEMPRDRLFELTRRSHDMTSRKKKARGVRRAQPIHPHAEKGIDTIIGNSTALESVREQIVQFSKVEIPVLITGETGTGKELAANAIHEAGNRSKKPFVAINCGAISESLLESELFGHEKGAFSGASSSHQGLFEEAADGTIFLDEIGEITPRLQVALLRVLETAEIRPVGSSQTRKIHCRIVASTNANLEALAQTNRFRQDIIFRLKRLEIHMPSLRDRAEDVLPLASHFLNTGRTAESIADMSAELMDALRTHPWPGNVRELRNTIERMRLMNSDKLYYDVADLDFGRDSRGPLAETRLSEPDIRPSEDITRYHATQPPKEKRSRVRRLELLRDLFRERNLLTRAEVVDLVNVSPNTATSDLQSLCKEGLIERIAPSASPRSAYFVLREDESRD
jgi:DNA-binding NtrC family response regulator